MSRRGTRRWSSALLAVAVLVGVLLVGVLLAPVGSSAAVGVPAGVQELPVARAAAQELPSPPTGRRRGLAVAVAVVALVGAGSLVVRVLLAVPPRRRR